MIGYLVFLTISTAIFALFSLGLNLQWGFTGLINFGHVAFMTLGAYTTVLLSLQGVPLIVAALAGAGLAALLGLIIGFATLRLREDYLAIVTIGVAELIRLVVNNQDLPVGSTWTSGAFGVQTYPIPFFTNFQPNFFTQMVMIALLTLLFGLSGWRLWHWVGRKKSAVRVAVAIAASVLGLILYGSGTIALYDYANNQKAGLMLLSLLVLGFVFWRLQVLINSPWGRVLKAIREDEEIPRALGKNVFWYKLQSLMLGGAIAGIAGAFYAWQLSAVYPDNFQPQITFDAWIMVILGGSGNNVGSILGAAIFFAYDAITREVLPRIIPLDEARLGAFRIMVIGLILMILMIWRPQGILGKKEELTLGK
jgi:neutral amino acid transport system permease protein